MLTTTNFNEVEIHPNEADQPNSGWYGPFPIDDETAGWVQDALGEHGLDLLIGVQEDENDVYVKVAPKPLEVESSMMDNISYDEAAHQLSITFKGGSVYHYYDVEQPIFAGLEQASSKGKFFLRHIRPWYDYKKIN